MADQLTPCVCGCASEHAEHCCHGCTIPFPDDGFDHGGSCFTSGQERYEGQYKRRFG